MKLEDHIKDILQLYEFGMSIGRSLDYKTSCDSFLKLLLKRKNLSAAYILEHNKKFIKSTYSIPLGEEINVPFTESIKEKLNYVEDYVLVNDSSKIAEFTTINITRGTVAVFNLKNQNYLILYTNNNNLNEKELKKLSPIIDKFSYSLEACRTFEKQERLLKSLKVQNQELNDYAHLVSHDLKSPLQSIEAVASWIIEDHAEAIGEAGKSNLLLIKENVKKMDTLVKGILEYSTLDKLKDDDYTIDINVLVDEVFNSLKYKENVTFIKKDSLPIVKGNTFKLKLLFTHLLKNAIKFNNNKNKLIEIGCKATNGFWEFYLRDNGKGIEEKYFKKIFKAFQKLENDFKSSGIGLTIVKKIIESYDGEIWLNSIPEEGTTFYFTIKK